MIEIPLPTCRPTAAWMVMPGSVRSRLGAASIMTESPIAVTPAPGLTWRR